MTMVALGTSLAVEQRMLLSASVSGTRTSGAITLSRNAKESAPLTKMTCHKALPFCLCLFHIAFAKVSDFRPQRNTNNCWSVPAVQVSRRLKILLQGIVTRSEYVLQYYLWSPLSFSLPPVTPLVSQKLLHINMSSLRV